MCNIGRSGPTSRLSASSVGWAYQKAPFTVGSSVTARWTNTTAALLLETRARDHWLEDWEKRAILDFYWKHPLDSYRGTSRNSLSTTFLGLFGISKFGLGNFFVFRGEIYCFVAWVLILLSFPWLLAMIHRCNSLVLSLASLGDSLWAQ